MVREGSMSHWWWIVRYIGRRLLCNFLGVYRCGSEEWEVVEVERN